MTKIDYVMIHGTHKAVHKIGDWVSVSWNTHEVTKTIQKDGLTYSAKVEEFLDPKNPRIEFINLRQIDGEWFEDDDNYITDWHNIAEARKISLELKTAIEYIEALQKDNGPV